MLLCAGDEPGSHRHHRQRRVEPGEFPPRPDPRADRGWVGGGGDRALRCGGRGGTDRGRVPLRAAGDREQEHVAAGRPARPACVPSLAAARAAGRDAGLYDQAQRLRLAGGGRARHSGHQQHLGAGHRVLEQRLAEPGGAAAVPSRVAAEPAGVLPKCRRPRPVRAAEAGASGADRAAAGVGHRPDPIRRRRPDRPRLPRSRVPADRPDARRQGRAGICRSGADGAGAAPRRHLSPARLHGRRQSHRDLARRDGRLGGRRRGRVPSAAC